MSDLLRTLELWIDANEDTYRTVREVMLNATRHDIGYRDTDPDDLDTLYREGREGETHASIGLAVRDALLDIVGNDDTFAVNVMRDLLNNEIDVDDLGAAFAIEDTDDYREWFEANR